MSLPWGGGEGAELHVHREIGGFGKCRAGGKNMEGEHHKRIFPNTDAAFSFALEHGYLQVYQPRPNGFIVLRLSPATRRYLRTKSNKEIWNLLKRILGKDAQKRGSYFHTVRTQSYMQETRQRWMGAIHNRLGDRHHQQVGRQPAN